MAIKHKHHIVPRHSGGSDDPSNLVELTIEEHAEAHRLLWEKNGLIQDKIAWMCLSGQITSAEAIRQAGIAANKGKTVSEETRHKMSIARRKRTPPTKGKTWSISPEKRINMGGKGPRPNFNQAGGANNNAKKILTPYGIFESISECVKHMMTIDNLNDHQLRYVIHKNLKRNESEWRIL